MLRRVAVALVVIGLPGLVLLPAWALGGLGACEDDLLYYFPSRVLFARFVEHGVWPWLNPLTGMDRPYLADPQSAVFYPLTWSFAWLAPLTAYALSLWAHYSLAMWGMLRLTRSRGCTYCAALFAAIAFAFCGFMLAHRAHFTMVQAAAWLPWVMWRLDRFAQRGGAARWASAAVVCALQSYAGHVQIAALTALGSLVFLLAAMPRRATAVRWLAVWVTAAGLFAAQAVPTWLYVEQCARSQRGIADFVENTWSPVSAVGWALPMLLGQRTPNFFSDSYWGPSHQVEQFAYPGVLTLLLAWLAWRNARRRDARPWLVLLAVSLLIATSILSPLLFLIPGANLLRVPARAMVLFNFALAGLAAQSLSALGGRLSPDNARCRAAALRLTRHPLSRAILWVIVCAAPFAIAWVFSPPSIRHAIGQALRPWNPALWVPLIMFVLGFASLRFVATRWRTPRRLWLVPVVLTLDLAVIGWTIDVPRGVPSAAALLTSPTRTAWLSKVSPGTGRLWTVTSRTNGVPGEYVHSIDRGVANTNILDGYQTLTDYGPLQPRGFVKRFGFEPWGELKRPAAMLRDTAWMSECNVGWVLLCDDALPTPNRCIPVLIRNGLRLYRNLDLRGESFLRDGSVPHVIRTESHEPYHFTTIVDFAATGARSAGTTRVVASRLALPGWTARVNGKPAATTVDSDYLLAVQVPAKGLVTIDWQYYPPGLTLGLITSGLTMLVVIIVLGWAARRAPRRQTRSADRPEQPKRATTVGV